MHVEFTHLQHLLQALDTYIDRAKLFPSQVIQTEKGAWAVPISLFGSGVPSILQQQFNLLCQQYGWQAQVLQQPPQGCPVFLSSCIAGGPWRYCDPLRLDRDGAGGDTDEESPTRYTPLDWGKSYLLGAIDMMQAERLLKALTNALTQGIFARPLLLENRTPNSPFSFFWVVTGKQLPLFVLEAAERVWWGPVGYGRIRIFEEWPYTLDFPDFLLHRVDWGSDARIVLLSRNEPRILVVSIPNDAPTFNELIEVSALQIHQSRILAVQSAPPDAVDFNFTVDLRLVDQDPRRLYASRISELELEVQAKQAILERMKDQYEGADEALDFAPEPLFLYADPHVPFQLRRLLVEWSDQSEDLRALRYLKLDGESLPHELTLNHTDVHVLTAASALSNEKSNNVGVRLWDYRPSIGGRYLSFDLLPEWTPFGLRLFIPHGLHLTLYPELRPSPIAAQKLAKTLLPHQASDIQDWVVLLLPSDDRGRKIIAYPLRISSFKPLIQAFEWDCALDIPVNEARTVTPIAAQARATILDAVADAFRDAVETEAKSRLDDQRRRLQTRLKQLGDELDEKKRLISQLEQEMTAVEGLLTGVSGTINRLRGEREALIHNLIAISRDVGKMQSRLTRLQQLAKELRALEEEAASLRNSREELQRQIDGIDGTSTE